MQSPVATTRRALRKWAAISAACVLVPALAFGMRRHRAFHLQRAGIWPSVGPNSRGDHQRFAFSHQGLVVTGPRGTSGSTFDPEFRADDTQLNPPNHSAM